MPTPQQSAADQAAQFEYDSSGVPFYAEISTQTTGNTPDWSNSQGLDTVTIAPLASVTKSLSACYAAWAKSPPGLDPVVDYPFLTMTSGYDWMKGTHCDQNPANPPFPTINDCCNKGDGIGHLCCAQNNNNINWFSYDSGHWQKFFNSTLGLGSWSTDNLAKNYQALFGFPNPWDPVNGPIIFSSAMPAGGAEATATALRQIIQQIMVGSKLAAIRTLLQNPSPAPVDASQGGYKVASTPAPPGPWKYKWGFWIEPDTYDFWMVGSFGTAVWIRKDFGMYGMVFRNSNSGGPLSMTAMQNIRRAYLTGVGPLDAIANSSIGPVTATPSKAVTPVIIVLTSGTQWTVPNNCTGATIECIGGGQSGKVAFGANGGAGGAYVKRTNLTLTPGAQINYQIGKGGVASSTSSYNNGQDTWFVNQTHTSTSVLAPGGGSSTPYNGDGYNPGGASGITGVGGGSGAGGPNAVGATGPTGLPPNGGVGDGSSPPGGAGGPGSSSTDGGAGGAGTEWVVGAGTVGAGGGGGGSTVGNGGTGGNYGGGGGGARGTHTAGAGANGVIVITYYAPA